MRKKSINGAYESQKSTRQVAYQRGNQKEGSPHYVFLYTEDDQSEDEEHFSLKIRNSQALPRKIEVINIQVQSEDTLQALALRYRCTISELKRINKIHKDNEIHAHRTIKVPVQPYLLLTEGVQKNSETDETKIQNTLPNVQTEENRSNENEMINLLANPASSPSSTVEINSIILNSTVEPLFHFNNESSQSIEETETDRLINSIELDRTNYSNNFVNTLKCSGADWGLSWFQLLCFSLLLGFAGPIIYLYIIESSKHHNSS